MIRDHGTQKYDAIVIGGGIIGAFSALELARLGVEKVLLLEKNYPGAGASGKSSAILRPTSVCDDALELARAGLEQYSHFRAETGLDIGFHEVGMVTITDHATAESFCAARDEATLLDSAALVDLEPEAVFAEGEFGIFEPSAATVHPISTVSACLEAARRQGVEVRSGVGVRAIESEGGCVSGVRLTDGGRVTAPAVVNAAGPWALGLVKTLGFELPLISIRTEQAYLETPPELSGRRLIFSDGTLNLTWLPEDAGWTRVERRVSFSGGGREIDPEGPVDPDHYDEGVSGEFLQRYGRRISERVPAYRTRPSRGGCGAIQTVTPDDRGIIASVPGSEGLIVAAGFADAAFSLAPAVGRGIAARISGSDHGAPDLSAFCPTRFEAPVPVAETRGLGFERSGLS